MIARFAKYVPFHLIEDHFRLGWMAPEPHVLDIHHEFGITMTWICECKVPK